MFELQRRMAQNGQHRFHVRRDACSLPRSVSGAPRVGRPGSHESSRKRFRRYFVCKYNDPLYVKLEKIAVMVPGPASPPQDDDPSCASDDRTAWAKGWRNEWRSLS